jgi:type IV secretion system protein VirB6
MMARCPAFDPLGPYVRNLVDFVDCHAVMLGAEGYRALGPGTQFGYALTGLLTIYVAFIGYRLLLGESVGLRDGVSIALRVGIVLALATQWSAYQPLVFDLATKGPEDVATSILSPGALGGDSTIGLTNRVQGVNSALDNIARTPLTQSQEPAQQTVTEEAQPTLSRPPAQTTPRSMTAEQQKSVALANSVLLVATLAGILSVHVVIGLLLALGPLLVACLLFDALRGFFFGWVRVLAGTALGSIAVPTVVALELAVLEPQVLALRAQLDAGETVSMLPAEILATTGLFAIVLFAALIGTAMVAGGYHLPGPVRREIIRMFERSEAQAGARTMNDINRSANADETRGRAHVVADAVAALERREQRILAGGAGDMRFFRSHSGRQERRDPGIAPQPLDQAGRRTARRQSTGGNRRDRL